MNLEIFAYPAVGLLAITSLGVVVIRNWRWLILLLALQFLGVFILASLSWPLNMVLSKLVAGWIICVVLWMAQISRYSAEKGSIEPQYIFSGGLSISGTLFCFFAAALVWLVVFSISPVVQVWLPAIKIEQVWGGLLLIGLGLLNLGMTSESLRVVTGLVTVLAGFEIVYSSVEISALVQGLLAVVNLAIGLVGVYLILAPTMELSE